MITPICHVEIDGWTIEYKYVGQSRNEWHYEHENHDGTNGLFGSASSLQDALAEIVEKFYTKQEGW